MTKQVETKLKTQALLRGDEDINFWSKDLAKAAVDLCKLGSVNCFVIMGGKTGGGQFISEAELINGNMLQLLRADKTDSPEKINPEIKLEKESTDTLENIINFLNLDDNDGKIERGEIKLDFLSAPYQSVRIQAIARLFDIPIIDRFRSDEILKYTAMTSRDANGDINITSDYSKWDVPTL